MKNHQKNNYILVESNKNNNGRLVELKIALF